MTMLVLCLAAIAVLGLIALRRVPQSFVIVDGDTIRFGTRDYRLSGFDAPEYDQPGGSQATEHLREIMRNETSWAYVWDVDAYNRPLAFIITLRGPLSWRMALAGHAHGEGRVGRLMTRIARSRRAGLWGIPGDIYLPSTWRANRLERELAS